VSDSWRQPRRLLLAAFGAVAVFFMVAPMLIVVPMSFSSSNVLEFPPPGFSLKWYEVIISDEEWSTALIASLQVAFLTAALATILGIAAAYGLVRGRFRGKAVVASLLVSPLVVPVVVIAIGMFSVYVAGWGIGPVRIGQRLAGSLPGLVLAHTVLAMPYVVVNVAASLVLLDRTLELAAMSLGANPWQTFRRISLPLILPGVLAGALFAFVASWDEVVVALFMTSPVFRTLPVLFYNQLHTQQDPTIAAVSTILMTITTTTLVGILLLRFRGQR
jgi:putative spermidine/putrescine transport system permease protein